jgi:hypothetical protein
MWRPVLGARGYETHFSLKRGASSSEGIATFTRRASLQLVEARTFGLDLAGADAAPPALRALLEAQPLTAAGVAALPTVGTLALLRHVPTGRPMLLGNTHLCVGGHFSFGDELRLGESGARVD